MRALFAIVLTGGMSVSAAAQTQDSLVSHTAMPSPASLTIRRLVPEVQMVITAVDPQGRPVLTLAAHQMTILDNGAAATLTSLRAADSLPQRTALLLDASDSMRPGFAAARQAALAFLGGMRRSPSDQVLTLTFAVSEIAGTQQTPAESSLPARDLGGQTALYDALITAAQSLRSRAPARRFLLLLSDGEDNYSRSTLGDALMALQESEIAVYAVSVHSPRLEYPGDRVLRQIAAATGGRAYILRNYHHAAGIFSQIEQELRGQYILGFRPSGRLREGEFRSVRILPEARDLRLRACPGYYVDPAD